MVTNLIALVILMQVFSISFGFWGWNELSPIFSRKLQHAAYTNGFALLLSFFLVSIVLGFIYSIQTLSVGGIIVLIVLYLLLRCRWIGSISPGMFSRTWNIRHLQDILLTACIVSFVQGPPTTLSTLTMPGVFGIVEIGIAGWKIWKDVPFVKRVRPLQWLGF